MPTESSPAAGAWMIAFRADDDAISAHARFADLIREVAVAEQGSSEYSWLARNSLTYGQWMRRGMPRRRQGPLRRRAELLAQVIAEQVPMPEGWATPEWKGRVYAAALTRVRTRTLHPWPEA